MEAVAEVVAALESSEVRRVAAIAEALPTIAAIGRMVDQLCDLHADLPPDDRLQQVLHALGFCWQQVESELLAVVKSRRN